MTDSIQSTVIQEFIQRWENSQAAERANYQLFLSELCDVLGVARPDPAQGDDRQNAYVFERSVIFRFPDETSTTKRIDLYKRGCFVLEAKQGSEKRGGGTERQGDGGNLLFPGSAPKQKKGTAVRGTKGWDDAMIAARGQADQYAREIARTEGWPPFLIVADIGHSIELYADFARAGRTYLPFPDPRGHRIFLRDLEREEIRERLRMVWTAPLELDPSRRSARVTREVATQLARLAKSFEDTGHTPEKVAAFLMRCVFTMFAEDVQLIPKGKFTEFLESLREDLAIFPQMMEELWQRMNTGGFSPILKTRLLQFNGGLFADSAALPVGKEQLELLIAAARSDWREVEPAIFGTLLERALDPIERHKLGAHYTPRAYVERLVLPTIIEPLRAEWEAVLAAAVTLARNGDTEGAAKEVEAFRRKLCSTRVLDPACGSGNFLYVTMEHMKRLEGEVLDALESFGEKQAALEYTGLNVDPHQFLGLEVNPRAAVIADLVLWLGYLQWHLRTRAGETPQEPILKNFRNVECRDAVLSYDRVEEVKDADGHPLTRWDGRTTKKHPVTGEDVPDETARVPLLRYVNARKAEWPEADFVVGNPPFIGNWRMRGALGDGYTETLRQVYKEMPESCDYVMYWWEQAAQLLRQGAINRFGFIATNSLRQTFNRKVLQTHLTAKNPLSLLFAIPDHPWVDSADGAAVRISMTVAAAGEHEGLLLKVIRETVQDNEKTNESFASIGSPLRQERNVYSSEAASSSQLRQERNVTDAAPDGAKDNLTSFEAINISSLTGLIEFAARKGRIFANLTIGADVAGAQALRANEFLSTPGVKLHGAGFIVTPEEAESLGLGRIAGLERHIRHYRNGRDINGNSRFVMVIDLDGLKEDQVRDLYPEVYQHVLTKVKPERDHNNEKYRRENWWLFGRKNTELRSALKGLSRYITTAETSKHRFFVFLDQSILPDNKLVNIALDDAYFLGVLSSRIHVAWALASGSRLGVGNDPVYVKTTCFEKFPFPSCDETQKQKIRALGEQLDAHRKRQQALHPSLTLTEMYNVLTRLRAGESLSEKEKLTHEQGLVSVLRQLHDELDRAVAESYGWPVDLSDEEILSRLVELNAARAAEERQGLIRWLRPEFQNPQGAQQTGFAAGDKEAAAVAASGKQEKLPWPKTLAEQAKAVRAALVSDSGVTTAEQLAKRFRGARKDKLAELLETLVSLGQAREAGKGKFAA